jgi:hypothetical protein
VRIRAIDSDENPLGPVGTYEPQLGEPVLNLPMPDTQVEVDGNNEGAVLAGQTPNFLIIDQDSNTVTPTGVTQSGNNFTAVVNVGGGDCPLPEATGGDETEEEIDGVNYKIHTFTSDGDFVVTEEGWFQFLIQGGGGSGGGGAGTTAGGGGGAGGLDVNCVYLTAGTYAVVVGLGGPATDSSSAGLQGENSSFAGRTAIGGGAGGRNSVEGTNGGCGGGNAPRANPANSFVAKGTAGQGGVGGLRVATGNTSADNYGGGGGGGTAGHGVDITGPTGGIGNAGGAGTEINFDGTLKTYGQGGQGGSASGTPTAGADGTGNGGQGGSLNGAGAPGGKGIVQIRYFTL